MKHSLESLLVTLGILLSSTTVLAEGINIAEFKTPEIQIAQVEPEQGEETETEQNNGEADKIDPEQQARYEKFVQADRLYLEGDRAKATQIYRELKEPFTIETEQADLLPEPVYQLDRLAPGAAVYWRNYQAGKEQNLETKTLIALKLLVEKHPEYIPGHITYAETLLAYEKEEEAQNVLERAVALYPSEPKLLGYKIEADIAAERYMEASIAARQFALFNPDHPEAKKFEQQADEYMGKYQDELEEDLTWNTIGSVITGGLSFALTGSLLGPLSTLETTMLMLQGEKKLGSQLTEQVSEQLPMLEDEEVLAYVRRIGYDLAEVAGRDEFEYEFHVVMDDSINAFALPGGKIFINAGAIMKTNSEAELAGLLAHELAHAVLSHGFQTMAKGSMTANITRNIPYVGGLTTNLIIMDYSRDMERQADVFGTKILTASGYAADGLRNLMVTTGEEKEDSYIPAWLSTHPEIDERVEYMEQLIVRNGYNRYAYEGVEEHTKIKKRVEQLWENYSGDDEESRQELREQRKPQRY